jgi:hypothetical protein
MNTTICILDLSDPKRPLAADSKRLGAVQTKTVLGDIPGPQQESLVLYVVGHGVQHGLVDSGGKILDEGLVAAKIRERRKGLPTLIVWDVCFAESMLKIGQGAAPLGVLPADESSWPSNFVHIFSCRSFERTWHAGRPSTKPPTAAITVFSQELGKAAAELPKGATFEQLETSLQSQLDGIQKPRIVPLEPRKPDDFELRRLLGGSLGSTGSTPRGSYAGSAKRTRMHQPKRQRAPLSS